MMGEGLQCSDKPRAGLQWWLGFAAGQWRRWRARGIVPGNLDQSRGSPARVLCHVSGIMSTGRGHLRCPGWEGAGAVTPPCNLDGCSLPGPCLALISSCWGTRRVRHMAAPSQDRGPFALSFPAAAATAAFPPRPPRGADTAPLQRAAAQPGWGQQCSGAPGPLGGTDGAVAAGCQGGQSPGRGEQR